MLENRLDSINYKRDFLYLRKWNWLPDNIKRMVEI